MALGVPSPDRDCLCQDMGSNAAGERRRTAAGTAALLALQTSLAQIAGRKVVHPLVVSIHLK